MNFYTSVNRYGNNILYRGYDLAGNQHLKRIKYKPSIFVPVQGESDWHGIDGTPIKPVRMNSMREAKEFTQSYGDMKDFKLFGNLRHVYGCIQHLFPNTIHANKSMINTVFMDIEVYGTEGFPEPEYADAPVTAICLYSSRSRVYKVFGIGPYTVKKCLIKGIEVDYVRCHSELDLLEAYIEWWSDPENLPDIISGWNTRFFDIPYMVNRITKLLGEDEVKKLSPWKQIDTRKVTIMGKDRQVYEISGVQSLDYMELFKKFAYTYPNQESYALNHIAYTVLGEKKLNYSDAFQMHNLFGGLDAVNLGIKKPFEEMGEIEKMAHRRKEIRRRIEKEPSEELSLRLAEITKDGDEICHQAAIDYNIKDVELLVRMEDKLGLIDIVTTMAYMGGVNFSDTLGTTTIWDTIIFRALAQQKIAVPANVTPPNRVPFPGGYVKTTQNGMHKWVVSFDLNSLYPQLMIQYNMSPETHIRNEFVHGISDQTILETGSIGTTSNYAVAANGAAFSRDTPGIIPSLIQKLYDQRVESKEKMLKITQEIESGDKSASALRTRTQLKNSEMAIKILLNSLYGAIGNIYFRHFDLAVAEGITASGRLAIRWAEKYANEYLQKVMSDDKDRVIASDTDSLYIVFDDLIEKMKPEDPAAFLDEFARKVMEPLFERAYSDLAAVTNARSNQMVMAREVIADRGIWLAKKRYILNVINSEGVQYEQPKLKMMGIEAIKSSTPEICRNAMRSMFKIIIHGDEGKTQDAIRDFRVEFGKQSPEKIACPRGVSSVEKYAHPDTLFIKGTPINSRASILYNYYLKQGGLQNKYQLISDGDKIKYLYLNKRNPIRQNVIGFPDDHLPEELNLAKYIDFDLQFKKTFADPIDAILKPIGWTLEPVSDLSDFFC